MTKKKSEVSYHSMSIEKLGELMQTDFRLGLSGSAVNERLRKYGRNAITHKKKISPLVIFLQQFKSPIVFLLVIAAGLSLWFGEWLDALAILVVLMINSVFGFYMEYKAERSMEALKKLTSTSAKVIRDGRLTETDSEKIVPGDIVFVEAGDLIPADGRIHKLSQLQADESALTGESIPVEKKTGVLEEDLQLADRTNMLYKGTFVAKGNAYMIVTATGMSTELGKVATLVQFAGSAGTPLEKKLELFSRKLIVVTVVFVVLIFITGLLNGHKAVEMLETSIALAVAAIPEGLPIVATMALAQGMIRMSRHNVIVKKLSAVETLGGTNMICTDKTGTLTKNRIEVKNIFPSSEKAEERIREISILCNTAELHAEGKEMRELGDPLETGLLKYYSKDGKLVTSLRKEFPKIHEEPFSSETRMMATLHQAGQGFRTYAKGAVEELIRRSDKILEADGEKKMNDEVRQHWIGKAEGLASSGMRVIALGYRDSQKEERDLSRELVFAGLIGMIDPPREDVATAISECRSAGIKVIMITGDHPSTARNIALQLNIIDEDDPDVMLGKQMEDFEQLSPADKDRWAETRVFARVSPRQKLDIVKVLQEKRYVVGMTGDGINDAPALKKADIGIAMGERGTQVAQEVADMIIRDDSFASIVVAVEQGRIIFENIRKFVIFLLSCNLSELLIIAATAILNLHFQLFPLQILFINLITDVLPALALAMTEGNPGIMKLKPRKMGEPIIDRKRWWTIIFYSIVISAMSLGAVLWRHFTGHDSKEWNAVICNNVLFFTLIFSQLLHVFNMGNAGVPFFRSEVFRNIYIWLALVASLAILLVIYLVEPVRRVLSIHPMAPSDWLPAVVASVAGFIIIRIAKASGLIYQ